MNKKSSGHKPPLRICHLADAHLGYRKYNRLTKGGLNQREVDVNFAFQEAITRIIALKPALVLVAGDLFHAVRPSNATLAFAFREIRRLAEHSKAPVVIIAGNHETPRRIDSGSALQLLEEIPGVYVAKECKERFVFAEEGVAVQCIPHAALTQEPRVQVRADDRVPWNILVTHAQVDDSWVSDFGGVNFPLGSIVVHEWDYIALGHVHIFKQIGLNAAYSGATEHTSLNIWGEADRNKGFLEVALPGPKIKFHALTSPREVVVLERIDAGGLSPENLLSAIADRIATARGGIEGKIVRLELVRVDRESFKHLDHKQLRALRAPALHFALDIHYADRPEVVVLPVGRKRKLIEEVRELLQQFPLQHSSAGDVEGLILKYLRQLEGADEASDTHAP